MFTSLIGGGGNFLRIKRKAMNFIEICSINIGMYFSKLIKYILNVLTYSYHFVCLQTIHLLQILLAFIAKKFRMRVQ